MELSLILEALGCGGEGSHKSLPSNCVRAELDAWDLAKQVGGYVYGGGLGDDSWWPYIYNIETGIPLKSPHVDPNSAAKRSRNRADSTPEVHPPRSLGYASVVEIRGNPVRKVSRHLPVLPTAYLRLLQED